jgi:hypothetical protein
VGRCARYVWGCHSGHPPRPAHHALDQRGRGLLHVCGLRLAQRRSLGTGRLHASGRSVALALILGGALGNVHDRICYGAVIDFIEVHIFAYHWPDFNVADSSIVIGACLMFLGSLLPDKTDSAL